MISFFVCAVLGQFKVGDEVYVKSAKAYAWESEGLAANRYAPSARSLSLGDARDKLFSGEKEARTSFRKGEKFVVLAVTKSEGEGLLKIKQGAADPWWMYASDLSALDESAKVSLNRDEIADKLRPFCITKPEHDALTVAVGKGLNPLTMTAEQAQALSSSQRRALSSVKARYLKGMKKR